MNLESALNEINQRDLIEAVEPADATPSHVQAIRMRNFSQESKIAPEVIESILCEEKPNLREKSASNKVN